MPGTHISLFAGVGMTDIAAEAAGYKTIATAEIDPACRAVLEARFPDAWHFNDVRQVRPEHFKAPLTIQRPLLVSGGFPCQDVSPAGTGAGLEGSRSGLWTEFIRVIRDFKPDKVLIENSQMLRGRGLGRILLDLCNAGYDARWDCLSAAAVGAPHLRDRIFVVAVPYVPVHGEPAWAAGCDATVSSRVLGVSDPASGDYIEKLPRAGHMRNGYIFYETPRWPIKAAREGAKVRLFPTPTRSDGAGGPGTTPKREGGKNLRTVVGEEDGNGRLNPEWIEWMMGLPLGWTDPSVTESYHPGWEHEPHGIPRTLAHNVRGRGKRIQMLGNGLVPLAALTALTELDPRKELSPNAI